MGTRVRQGNSSAVVEIADELVARYEAQGWVVVEVKPAAVAAPTRRTAQK